MEVQENQHPDFSSWVVLDQRFRYEDPGSLRADRGGSRHHPLPAAGVVRPPHRLPERAGAVFSGHHRDGLTPHRDAVLFRIQIRGGLPCPWPPFPPEVCLGLFPLQGRGHLQSQALSTPTLLFNQG